MHNCCNNYTRSQLLRSAAAEAGKGLPAIEPGMPEPAGTGLVAAQLPLAQRRASRSPVYGASKIPLAAFEEGIAQAAADATRSSSRSSSTAASTRSACWRRSATRATRSCGRTSPSRPAPGRPSPRTPRLQLAPGRREPGDPARRGQGQRLPGDRLRPPRPVALHLAPLLRDRRARRRLPHRLAGPLPRPRRRRRQPAAGPLDGRLALADDRHRRQAGGGDRQRRRLRPLVGGRRTGRGRDVPQLRPLRLAARRLAGLAQVRASDRPDRQAAHGPRRGRRLHQPGRLPRNRLRPQARRRSPPTSPSACRCGW